MRSSDALICQTSSCGERGKLERPCVLVTESGRFDRVVGREHAEAQRAGSPRNCHGLGVRVRFLVRRRSQSEIPGTPSEHGITKDDAITIGRTVRVTGDRSKAFERSEGHAVRSRGGPQSSAVRTQPPEAHAPRTDQLCHGSGEPRIEIDIARGGVEMIGDAQERMQRLLLRLLGLGKAARILERERR